MSRLLIRGGRVIDPANNVDDVLDIEVRDGKIHQLGNGLAGDDCEIIEAAGHWVIPGVIDLCARLREPGALHKAHIKSEALAAAHAGVTTLCCPPDTDPVIDEPSVIDLINQKAASAGGSHVVTLGALTEGLRGEQLSEMWSLQGAGCVGVSNALQPIENTMVLRRALAYAANCGFTVHIIANDPWLSAGGCAHEGPIATRLGLQSIPVSAETTALARVIELIADTGVTAHIGRLSAAASIKQIAEAKQRGLNISADVSAHQLHLTEHDISDFNADCHVLPPLRTRRDKEALQSALADGTIDAVCSDHQPHNIDAKQAPFASTEPGISAVETLLPLTLKLAQDDVIDLATAISSLTSTPARILGLNAGQLGAGSTADICIIDPDQEWQLDAKTMRSRGKNTPFTGWGFRGRVSNCLVGGSLIQ